MNFKHSIFLLPLIMVASCVNNDGPSSDEFISYDILQLSSVSRNATTFTFYKPDSDTPVTYTDPRGAVIDTSLVAVGEQMLLGYIPQSEPYVSGTIEAIGYSPVSNAQLMITDTPVDIDSPNYQGIYVYSIWRTGPFLNVHGKVTYTDEESQISLTVTRESLNNPEGKPEVSLTYYMEQPVDNFQRDFYVSFDISELTGNGNLKGFAVNVDNTNLKQNRFDFILNP